MADLPPMHSDRRPRFDPTINLGHLLTMGSLAATIIMGYASLNTRLGAVEGNMATLTSVVERSIRSEEQIRQLMSRMERLEGK